MKTKLLHVVENRWCVSHLIFVCSQIILSMRAPWMLKMPVMISGQENKYYINFL